MKLNCHNLLRPQSCTYIIDTTTTLVSMFRSAASQYYANSLQVPSKPYESHPARPSAMW